MNRDNLSWWVGFFALVTIVAALFVALKASNLQFNQTAKKQFIAYFDQIGGLKERSAITIAGVLVGRVANIELDATTFEAKVTLAIFDDRLELPEDTSASILTSGLLGEQYIGLTPGGVDISLESGDVIEQTQSAVVLEDLISRFLFANSDDEN